MRQSNKFDETYGFVNQNLRSHFRFELFMQIFDWIKQNAQNLAFTFIGGFILFLAWVVVDSHLTDIKTEKERQYKSSRFVSPECIEYGDHGILICDTPQR